MHRKDFIRTTALIAGGSLLFRSGAWGRSAAAAAGKLELLRGNVGIYTERGGTMAFHLDPSGITVIDSQFPDTAARFMAEVRQQQDAPFHILLNTHHHGDHTGGNSAFRGKVPQVFAHAHAAANLQAVATKNNTLEKQLLPDTTFTKSAKIRRDKERIRAAYFGRAHTNGDAVYHFEKANVAHVGDLVFNRRHPFVDRAYGASLQSWMDVLDRIVRKYDRDTVFIFGHAAEGFRVTGSADDIRAFRDYIGRVLDFARQEIAAGKTKEAFLLHTSIPGVSEWKGDGIARPLAAAWEELTEAGR